MLDFGPQSFQSLSRRLRAALGFLYGEGYLPLPRRRPIFMVCGKPIPVTKVPKTDPQVGRSVVGQGTGAQQTCILVRHPVYPERGRTGLNCVCPASGAPAGSARNG